MWMAKLAAIRGNGLVSGRLRAVIRIRVRASLALASIVATTACSMTPSREEVDRPAVIPAASRASAFQISEIDVSATAEIKIVGGTKAEVADWPATLRFDGHMSCTATLVGEQVVLTAAHCVSDGDEGDVIIGGDTFRATCSHHTSFREHVSGADPEWWLTPDFALCSLEKPVVRTYESIEVGAWNFPVGHEVWLLGYGCTRVGGADFGALYIGAAEVESGPTGDSYLTFVAGKVTLCHGDSGGGAYDVAANGDRRIIGVNATYEGADRSGIAATGIGGFATWARRWADDRKLRICGIHADASGCRANE